MPLPSRDDYIASYIGRMVLENCELKAAVARSESHNRALIAQVKELRGPQEVPNPTTHEGE